MKELKGSSPSLCTSHILSLMINTFSVSLFRLKDIFSQKTLLSHELSLDRLCRQHITRTCITIHVGRSPSVGKKHHHHNPPRKGNRGYRARHWCLPHCPGQVEFVNYSCGASENCILLAPLGKNILYISGLLLRMCASFVVCHPSLS